MREKLKNNLILAAALTFIGLIIGLTLIFFNIHIKNNLSVSICETLEEVMEQQAFNFSSAMHGDIHAMDAIAELFPYEEVGSRDVVIKVLSKLAKHTAFEALSYADINGKALSGTGIDFDVSDRPYFKKIMSSLKPGVSDPLISKIQGRSAIVLIVGAPMIRDGKLVGAILAAFDAEKLNNLFLSSFGDKGYAYVVNNSGDIIAKTSNAYTITTGENLFDDWNKANFYFGDDIKTIKGKFAADKSGHARYELDGKKRLAHYATIGVNSWNLISVVPEEAISESADNIMFFVYLMTLLFVVVFGALVFGIFKLQRKHIKELSEIAFVDELTGAPTLAKFRIEAQLLIEENPNTQYVVVKIDIDRFKLINQTFGFEEGDRALKNTAKALRRGMVSGKETYAKLNTDEYLLLHEYKSEEHLFAQRQFFLDTFSELMGAGFTYNVLFPTGHYYLKKDGCKDIVTAIERANIAHKKAKRSGVEVCVYDESFMKEELKKKEIENRMECALEQDEFKMYLQPKYYLASETIAGAEALVRWNYDGAEVVYPGSFIPLFEQNGFITKLDMYMFEKTCKLLREWLDSGIEPITISVNFSRNHINNINFVSELCVLADKYQVPRRYLEIELTESAIFDNEQMILKVLNDLHNTGFTLSMDDFGTGYSSLGMLKNIPIDVVKIDRGFFMESEDMERAKIVIANVIKMAQELKIKIVAEGVETQEQIDLLRGFGCDIVQGYYYAKPMPSDEMTRQLKTR